jgi:hypothetical protein
VDSGNAEGSLSNQEDSADFDAAAFEEILLNYTN